jgi:hypothetical protein
MSGRDILRERDREDKQSTDQLRISKMDTIQLPPSGSVSPGLKQQVPGIHLLSYLEKSKIKEDMRRLMSGKVMQLRTFIELDYFDYRSQIKTYIINNDLNEGNLSPRRKDDTKLERLCQLVNQLDALLIDIKSCDVEYPDLNTLKASADNYNKLILRVRPSVYFATEEQMKQSQDKISLCRSVIVVCDVYCRNQIWKEHIEGTPPQALVMLEDEFG